MIFGQHCRHYEGARIDTKRRTDSTRILNSIPGTPPRFTSRQRNRVLHRTNSGTALISQAPYRLAPAEMKELKAQLEELLEKRAYSTQSVPVGSAGSLREKERRLAETVHRLPGTE